MNILNIATILCIFQEAAQVIQAGYLRSQNQRFRLTVESKIPAGTRAVVVRFAQPLDFHHWSCAAGRKPKRWLFPIVQDFLSMEP